MRYPGYSVKQYNIVIDVLGGYSRDVSQALRDLVGEASSKVARRMQTSVLSISPAMSRSFSLEQQSEHSRSCVRIFMLMFDSCSSYIVI